MSRFAARLLLTFPVSLMGLCLASAWLGGCGDGGGSGQRKEDASLSDGGASHATGGRCESSADAGMSCGEDAYCAGGRCVENTCGDGVRFGGEECDDGNQELGDTCTPSCKATPVTCGDAKVDAPEECDDGNWFDLDDCANTCTVNACGNGRTDGLEECDDGNDVDTDACSNSCSENRCRNGRLDPGEECDDGNRIQNDGCTNACQTVICGNGRTEGEDFHAHEECDDGNRVNGDACSNQCTANECGNRRIDPGEACDGDTSDYVCSSDCKQKQQNSKCDACRSAHCTNYLEVIPTISLCLENSDADFQAQCKAVVDCAHTNGCGFTESGLQECWCGSKDPSTTCQVQGAGDGPCRAEFYTAARATTDAEVQGNLSALDFPLGAAYYLIECERVNCLEECGP